jgi:hypothetical protein
MGAAPGGPGSTATIASKTPDVAGFGTMASTIPADALRGKTVRFRGYLSTSGVEHGWAGLWMRVDDANGQPLAFDNMDDRGVTEYTDYRPYEIVMKVPDAAADIAFGVLLAGGGQVSFNETALEIVEHRGRQVTAATDWYQAGDDLTDYAVSVDPNGTCGRAAAVVQSTANAPQGFSTIMEELAPDAWRGKRVKLSVHVKSDQVSGWAGVWMRVDSRTEVLADNDIGVTAFDNMQDRPITGTSDWHRYEVVLDVDPRAVDIAYGVLLDGPGKVWVDEASFAVVDDETPVTH